MTSVALAGARTFRSLRRHHNYRLFFGGQVVSLAGTWMQNVALAWLVIELGGGALGVGALAFCRFLPFTVLGLFSGTLADRFDTRRLVMVTQGAAMLVSVALAAVTLSDRATLPVVYLLATFGGITLVLDAPARHALTFQMVGPRELPNAVALNSGLFNASRVVGPMIAGVLIAAIGTGWCFAVNAVSFVSVLVALAAFRRSELVPVERDDRPGFLAGTRRGLAWVWHTPRARTVLAVVTVSSALGFNFHVLIPLLAAETLDVGPEGLGVLSAAFGSGALAGALLAASRREASTGTFVVGTATFSTLLLVLAPISTVAPALVVLFGLGIAFTQFTTSAMALVQLAAPDHLRGRVIAIYLFAFAGLTPLGGLLAGTLAEVGGTALPFALGGIMGLGAAAWAARELRRPAM